MIKCIPIDLKLHKGAGQVLQQNFQKLGHQKEPKVYQKEVALEENFVVKQQTEVEQQETEFVSVVGCALLTLFQFL